VSLDPEAENASQMTPGGRLVTTTPKPAFIFALWRSFGLPDDLGHVQKNAPLERNPGGRSCAELTRSTGGAGGRS
jgi:hypothetical protein